MSGAKLLKGLKDATLPEKIIKIKSLLKEGIDIDENVKSQMNMVKLEHILHDVDTLNYTAERAYLSKSSREVAVHIAGYLAKIEKKKRVGKWCSNYLIEEFDGE